MPDNQSDFFVPDFLDLHINVTETLGQFASWTFHSDETGFDGE